MGFKEFPRPLYYYNGGDMLELVRYQKKTGIEEEKKEEKVLSSM